MLLINCPHCGPRAEIEFRCGGEAHITRPADPSVLDDTAWAEFLFYRTSPKGEHAERWLHAHGCQRWFNAKRDTASDRIIATYKAGEPRPDIGSTVDVRSDSTLFGFPPSPLEGEGRGGG